MHVRRLAAFFLVLLLGVSPVSAQPGGDLTSFPLLRLEPSARAAALGGSFAAVGDGDVNAVFYNPSVTGPATSRTASVSYLNHLADLNAGSVAYSRSLPKLGTTVHGGLRFADWGTFEGRDEQGVRTGNFSAGNAILTLGASRPYGSRLRYGSNLHLMYAYTERERASVLAFDLGGVYHVPASQFSLGAALRTLGTTLKGRGGTAEDLPLDLQVGLSKRLKHVPVLLTVTAYDLTNLSQGIEGGDRVDHVLSHVTFGTEIQPGDVLRLRVGYNHRRSTELALTDRFDMAGIGLGFGLTVQAITVDYAYNSWSTLGGLHQFTLRANLTSL